VDPFVALLSHHLSAPLRWSRYEACIHLRHILSRRACKFSSGYWFTLPGEGQGKGNNMSLGHVGIRHVPYCIRLLQNGCGSKSVTNGV
jgi:hypothetical protein